MSFLDGIAEGPAPIAGGIAQVGAGALQYMDAKEQRDRQYGIQQAQLEIQQQNAQRLQEAWDMKKAEIAANQEAQQKWGEFLATGKVNPAVSSFYRSVKSDLNNNGVPDRQEGISPEMGMAPGAAPMGGGGAGGGGGSAKGQTWGTTVLRGQPELAARGQSLVADGQNGLKQLQDHIQGLAAQNPQAAARLQQSPQYQDTVRRLNFMVSEGQQMIDQHRAAQLDMAVPLGVAALRMGQFEDARKFLGGVGLNLPPIKRTYQDPKTGQFRVQFDNGSGISMSMEELQGLGSLDVPPKERLEYLKDVMKANMDFQGKAMTAEAGVKEAQIRAYAPTSDQKNAAEIEKLDKQIAALPEGDPKRKALENKLYNMRALSGITDSETRRAGEKAREARGASGASGKALPTWSADDARQAKEYEAIIRDPGASEEDKADAAEALRDLRAKLIPPPPKAIRREGESPTASQDWGESGGQSGWPPSAAGGGITPQQAPAARQAPSNAALVRRSELEYAMNSRGATPQQKQAARLMLRAMGNRQEAYFDRSLRLVE